MNLYRYFEAKAQNKKTAKLVRALVSDGRVKSLPSSLGSHYRKIDRNSPDFDLRYSLEKLPDSPIIELLTCSNELEVQLAKNNDVNIIGAHHCGNKYLCACCGTREARRVSSQLRYSFLRLRDQNYKYFMLTLTLPNRFDGFRLEFDIYNRCITKILNYLGWRSDRAISCQGAFCAKELTYTKNKGFHPHLHCILAFSPDSITDYDLTYKGSVKSFTFFNGRTIDSLDIRNKFVYLIEKYFLAYYADNAEKLVNANIDFRPIEDIDDCCDELCKYFIDYNSFSDPDSLYIYLNDVYRLKKYSKIGCFGWSEELEDEWREWCRQGKPTERNAHFIQFVNALSADCVYFGSRLVVNKNGKKARFPCYYHKDELVNDGQKVYLSFDSSSNTYRSEVFFNSDRCIRTICIDKDVAKMMIKDVRSDLSIVYQNYLDSGGHPLT